MNYSETNSGVGSFDEMYQNMNAERKTKSWPLSILYNMVNIASINTYIMCVHNFYNKKTGTTKPFCVFNLWYVCKSYCLKIGLDQGFPFLHFRMTWKKNIVECLGIKNAKSTHKGLIEEALSVNKRIVCGLQKNAYD